MWAREGGFFVGDGRRLGAKDPVRVAGVYGGVRRRRRNCGGILWRVCIGLVGGCHLRGKGQLWGGIGIEECDEYCGDLRVQW